LFLTEIKNKPKKEKKTKMTLKQRVSETVTHTVNIKEFRRKYADLCIYDVESEVETI